MLFGRWGWKYGNGLRRLLRDKRCRGGCRLGLLYGLDGAELSGGIGCGAVAGWLFYWGMGVRWAAWRGVLSVSRVSMELLMGSYRVSRGAS